MQDPSRVNNEDWKTWQWDWVAEFHKSKPLFKQLAKTESSVATANSIL